MPDNLQTDAQSTVSMQRPCLVYLAWCSVSDARSVHGVGWGHGWGIETTRQLCHSCTHHPQGPGRQHAYMNCQTSIYNSPDTVQGVMTFAVAVTLLTPCVSAASC